MADGRLAVGWSLCGHRPHQRSFYQVKPNPINNLRYMYTLSDFLSCFPRTSNLCQYEFLPGRPSYILALCSHYIEPVSSSIKSDPAKTLLSLYRHGSSSIISDLRRYSFFLTLLWITFILHIYVFHWAKCLISPRLCLRHPPISNSRGGTPIDIYFCFCRISKYPKIIR